MLNIVYMQETLSLAADRLWNCIRELSGTADGSTRIPRSTPKKSSKEPLSAPASSCSPTTSAETAVQSAAALSGDLWHPSATAPEHAGCSPTAASGRHTAAGQQKQSMHPSSVMYTYPYNMPMIATQPNHAPYMSAMHARSLPQTAARSPLSGAHHSSPFTTAPIPASAPMHAASQLSPARAHFSLAPVATHAPASPSHSDYGMYGMNGAVMYPCTPSTASARDGSSFGGSHSAPLQNGGGSGDHTMHACFMGRAFAALDTLSQHGSGGSGGVQLDAEEKKAARRLVSHFLHAVSTHDVSVCGATSRCSHVAALLLYP